MFYQKNPSLPIIRQDLFIIKREGYAIGFPKKSNWHKDFQEFSMSINLKNAVQNIIPNYFDASLLPLINNLNKDTKSIELSMLEKEKEIQQEHLNLKEKAIELEKKYTTVLIIVAILFLVLAILIYVTLRKTKKDHLKLIEQNFKIDLQQKNISDQNSLLEKKNERLIGLNEEKNSLMRVLAHDLRAPLASIKGLTEITMMDGENLKEDQKTNLNFITETVTRMSRMINNLLDSEAIEKGESKLLLENTELVTIIGSAIRNMQSLASQKQIHLAVQSKVMRAIVKADYVMLMEVLENLISKAKYDGKSFDDVLKEYFTNIKMSELLV
jgi:K+-sensing histidine kinase KdpD